MKNLKTIGIMLVMVAGLFAGQPSNAAAEDWLVQAESPGYEIVVGKDVTFKWSVNENYNPREFELKTSSGTIKVESSAQQYTWHDFPYGSSEWTVKVWGRLDFYIGKTSEQNFYHFNNTPGTDSIESTDWEYKDGPRGGVFDTTLYYEVMKDYTVDLRAYFANIDKLPGKYFKWEKTEAQRIAILDYINNLPTIKWDFIELENGMLTVKKGYRWDGASTPWNNLNIADNREFYIRCSCIHDSIYDLMRMGYLQHDEGADDTCIGSDYEFADAPFLNRLIADSLLYMIMIEDGRGGVGAQSDFEIVRFGGACKTHKDALLAPWKYHVSELTAWASDGKVSLHWLPADISGKDPNGYGSLHLYESQAYYVYRARSGSNTWDYNGYGMYPKTYFSDFYNDSKVFFTDTTVTNGEIYYYQIKSAAVESDVDWKDRHYDESNVEAVVPVKGPGNALQLEGNYHYVEANTVSNGLSGSAVTFEAWVYPEIQSDTDKTAILSFNTADGGNDNLLMYDGANEKFCYYDDGSGHIYSAAESAPGHWYHVAVTIDDNDFGVLWVDGEQEETFYTAIRPKKTALFSIGQEWDGITTSQQFKGKIDEVRIWNVARTQAEIQSTMCSPAHGNHAGMVGLWHFDEPHNSRKVYDATIHGHDGTLKGYDIGETSFVPSGAMTPMAVARDFTVQLDAAGNAFITAEQVDASFADTCAESMSVSPSSFTCGDIGPNTVTLTVTDKNGNVSTADAIVTVEDNIPPEISNVVASAEALWPPNHKMVPVEIIGALISDNCGDIGLDNCKIVSVTSNEPINDSGDGNTDPDYEITDDLTVDLRAERSGSGNGRTYTITLECMDASENSSTATVDIYVPHDQGKKEKERLIYKEKAHQRFMWKR